jgi:hypothetical protein
MDLPVGRKEKDAVRQVCCRMSGKCAKNQDILLDRCFNMYYTVLVNTIQLETERRCRFGDRCKQ